MIILSVNEIISRTCEFRYNLPPCFRFCILSVPAAYFEVDVPLCKCTDWCPICHTFLTHPVEQTAITFPCSTNQSVVYNPDVFTAPYELNLLYAIQVTSSLCFWHNSPTRARTASCSRFLNHTQLPTTVP